MYRLGRKGMSVVFSVSLVLFLAACAWFLRWIFSEFDHAPSLPTYLKISATLIAICCTFTVYIWDNFYGTHGLPDKLEQGLSRVFAAACILTFTILTSWEYQVKYHDGYVTFGMALAGFLTGVFVCCLA